LFGLFGLFGRILAARLKIDNCSRKWLAWEVLAILAARHRSRHCF
jgi:hypothetical protein